MSFHPFMPPPDPDFPDNDHPGEHHIFPRHRPPPPEAPLARPHQQWSPAGVNYTSDMFFQGNSGSPYYALSSALTTAAASTGYPESSPYTQSEKLDNMPVQPSLYPRYPAASFSQYSMGYMDNDTPYHPAEPYSEPFMLHPAADEVPADVKDEPSTPSSPQFIFEFPGGEDEPPPFELASAPVFCDRGSVPTCDSPALEGSCSTSRTRPGSPTTEAMKSMMSVFRVDPFASYDADSGTRRKRRKRGSTYARTTDPEASSKEEPLMFTFQLDVGPPDWADDDADVNALCTQNTALHEDLYTLPSPDGDMDYAVFDDDPGIQHPSFAPDPGSPVSCISRTVTLSMPVPLQGGASTLFNDGEYPEKYLPSLFPPVDMLYASDGSLPAMSQDPRALITYPSSHSRQSSLTPSLPEAESDTFEEAADVPPSTASLLVEGTTANSVPASSTKHSRSRPPTKMHICWICHKEFPRPSGLATHMNTHSGAKPYKCPVPACSKTFAVRSNARRHLRIHGTPFDSMTPFYAVSPDTELRDRDRDFGNDDPSPGMGTDTYYTDLTVTAEQDQGPYHVPDCGRARHRDMAMVDSAASPSGASATSTMSPSPSPGQVGAGRVLSEGQLPGLFGDGGAGSFIFGSVPPPQTSHHGAQFKRVPTSASLNLKSLVTSIGAY